MSTSVWDGTAREVHFPSLHDDLHVDVAIIGGGITGLTTAMILGKAGMRVAVLDAGRIGDGTTGHSTGNLYAPVDWHLYAISDKWDTDTMQAVAHSRQDAVDLVEMTVRSYGIDCQFARRPFYLFATSANHREVETIEREYRAAIDAHLNARVVKSLPLSLHVEKALIIEGQAQFHPLNYVRGLAERLATDGCRIYENSEVMAIDDRQGLVRTDGGQVRADHIVMATHTPKGVFAVQMEMQVFREYGIAARLHSDTYPTGIFWSVGTKHSIRSVESNGDRFLIVVGEKHKTGEDADAERRTYNLERFAREHFDVANVAYAWSAQQYRSADELPYIGRAGGSQRTYIATGFASDGLTYGTLAAMTISEAIFGRESKWSDLYEPDRIEPVKAAQGSTHESADVVRHLTSEMFMQYPETFAQVPAGEGKVLEVDGEKLAVYRAEDDTLTAVSALCTHLQCTVHWNDAEKSWDCPCHGSRFTRDGMIIEGPALAPLEVRFRGRIGEPARRPAHPAPPSPTS
jgi:glycine/D-amino acid oxidase-like deaminating enzyme/nitrite reductase/ring-hydroxylating ferredoxin subunit